MKRLKFPLILLLVLTFFACDSESDDAAIKGTLIFGWFADASCSGDCAKIYKIDNGNVYRDIDYNYPENTFFTGNFQLMTNANYQNFKTLIAELPSEILNEPNGYVGCDTCTNANGGLYIEYITEDGFHKSWRIHNAIFSSYLENYRSLIIDKLEELNSL